MAVLKPPMCKGPVGLGAKRTLTLFRLKTNFSQI